MSHFYVGVVVKKQARGECIEAEVARLLAPFDEKLDVTPYKKYEKPARMAEYYQMDPSDWEGLAKRMKDWTGCEGGVDGEGLFYWSTYNPESKWDWYRIGGRWDGVIRGIDRPSKDDGFNFGDEHQRLIHNVVEVNALLPFIGPEIDDAAREKIRLKWDTELARMEGKYGPPENENDIQFHMGSKEPDYDRHPDDRTPRALVYSLNGEPTWVEKGRMGWFGVSVGDIEHRDWANRVKAVLADFPDHLVVGVDCHI